jgi:hypothetical protein
MAPGGPLINAAKQSTDSFDVCSQRILCDRFQHPVKPDDATGNEKVGQKPEGVLVSFWTGLRTNNWHYTNANILAADRITIASMRISMNVKRVDFTTQRTRLMREPEVTLMQEFGYAVFDDCAVFTVVSGASSARTEERPFF